MFLLRQEVECLEDNLEELQPACKKAITDYALGEAEDPTINSIFVEACAPFWDVYCQVGVRNDIIVNNEENRRLGVGVVAHGELILKHKRNFHGGNTLLRRTVIKVSAPKVSSKCHMKVLQKMLALKI